MEMILTLWLLGFSAPLAYMFSLCCCAFCANCTSQFASQYQVDISGISNGTDCSDCDQYNGTFTLDKVDPDEISAPPVNSCVALWVIDPCWCIGSAANTQQAEEKNAVNQLYFLAFASGANTVLRVSFAGNNTGSDCHVRPETVSNNYILWNKTVVNGADCGALAAETITFLSDASSGCDSDGSAALVSAL